MLESNEYCIPSGTFAKLCNTTRDTLRYYEQTGVLVPHKNPDNNYGYYSYAQITSYYFIAIFRTLGCPVAEIHSFLDAQTPEAFDPFINKQYETLLRMQQELKRNLESLSISLLLVEKIRSCPGAEPFLSSLPGTLRLRQTKIKGTAYHAGDLLSDLHRHIEDCKQEMETSTFPIGVAMTQEEFIQGKYRYHNLISFTQNKGKETIPLPCKKILCFVHRSQLGDISMQYEKLTAYATSHQLNMISDIYSISLVDVVYPNDSHQYLKFVFVCVEP